MAEFLVFAEDRTNIKLTLEGSTALIKRGDIVEVQADGFVWGREESKAVWVAEGRDPNAWPGKTILVKVPGMLVPGLRAKAVQRAVRVAKLGDPSYDPDNPAFGEVTVHQYAWRINLRSLPAVVKAQIIADREITVTKAQLRRRLDHKVTRRTFDERNAKGEGRLRTTQEKKERP